MNAPKRTQRDPQAVIDHMKITRLYYRIRERLDALIECYKYPQRPDELDRLIEEAEGELYAEIDEQLAYAYSEGRIDGREDTAPATKPCDWCAGTGKVMGEECEVCEEVSTARGCNPEEARTNAGATPNASVGPAAGNLPERRELPTVDASYACNSAYLRALGWNECLDELARRALGVTVTPKEQQ